MLNIMQIYYCLLKYYLFIKKELYHLRKITTQFFVQSSHSLKWILFIAIFTAFAGELKILPFEQVPFRIGLGSIAFFFLLLITNVRIFSTGIFTAIFVLLFRACLDVTFFQQSFYIGLIENIPAAIYYIVFSFLMDKLQLRKLKDYPLRLGFLAALFEFTSNIIEQLFTVALSFGSFISLKYIILLLFVAFLRSFFVVGIYSSLTLAEQKKKMYELFKFQTNLYTETLYMKETMQKVEHVTADSFSLYAELRKNSHPSSIEALRIASEIHEVKKNTQRIVAGLAHIMNEQKKTSFSFMQIITYIKQANERYARLLNKQITITVNGQIQWHTNNYLAFLSIFHNIVSNAVEAIDEKGTIEILLSETNSNLSIIIRNDGPMIIPSDLSVLFDAGFTTKFDSSGNASTGIGLYHVKSLTESLNGTIQVDSNLDWTTFTFQFKKHSL